MKICSKCKKVTPNNRWSWKFSMCSKCAYIELKYARNPNYKLIRERLEHQSKEELIKRLLFYETITMKNQTRSNAHYKEVINIKRRLTKIKREIDYIIQHPFANDTGYRGRKLKENYSSMSNSSGENEE